MRRLLVLLALVAAALLAPAGAAHAEGEFGVEERLVEAGLADAYLDQVGAERGVRVFLDFTSGSASRQEYDAEARRAAEVVWEHLSEPVAAFDVTPTSGVSWLDGDLPPAVSFTRSDLTTAFGARPGGLEDVGSGRGTGGLVAAVAAGLAGLLALVAVTVLVVVLVRRRRRTSGAGPSWPAPSGPAPGWPAPAWPATAWGAPGSAPPGTGAGPPTPWPPMAAPPGEGSPLAAPDPSHPWRTP